MFIMHVAFIITFLFVCLFFGCFLVKKKFLQNLEFSVCKFDENKNKNSLKKNKKTNTKLYALIVPLSSKDNVKLVKLLEDGFNRPVYWNEYQTKIKTRNLDNNNFTRFPLDVAFQGVRRLFVLAFNNTATVPNDPINNTANRV